MTTVGLEKSAAGSLAHPAGVRLGRRWIGAGAATAAIVTIIRWWISLNRDELSIWPDEPAQLAMARFLGGGVPWTMHDHSTWQPGYATLLSPAHWFTDDPVTVLHAALALNAVLGGAAAWLIVLLVRRLTPLGPLAGAAVATIVALAPAALFTTVFVWSESLVAVLFLATVIALLRFGDSPTIGRGVLAGAGAALAFGTHSRMLPLAVVTIGVAVAAAARREASPGTAGTVVLATVAAMVGVKLYTGFVVDRLWDEPSATNSLRGAFDHLVDAPNTTVIALAGQAWYVLVSTVGVAVYGTVELARATRDRHAGTARRDAVLVLVVAVCCVAPSVLFMANRFRPDQIVYGRYNDVVIVPILVVGLGFLLTTTATRRIVNALAASIVLSIACAAALLIWRRGALGSGSGIEPMILGLQSLSSSTTSIDVVRITTLSVLVSAGVAAAAIGARRIRQPALLIGVLAAVLVVANVRTANLIADQWNGRGDLSDVAQLGDDELAGGAGVEFFLPDGASTDRLMMYQLYLPENRFTVVEDLDDSGQTPFIFAPTDDPVLSESATVVWRDPYVDFGLWRR